MEILGFILFGLVVGVVARLIVPGRQRLGLAGTVLLGIVGSIIGGVVASMLGTGDMFELNVVGALVAFAAAAVLIALGEGAFGRRRGLR